MKRFFTGLLLLSLAHFNFAQTPFLVKDINPGEESSLNIMFEFSCLGDLLIFPADDGVHGREIWASDGTEEGTYMIKDVHPGPDHSIMFSGNQAVLNGAVIFVADDGESGRELWRTDGTEEGTYIIKDINPGTSYGFTNRVLFRFENKIYFVGRESYDVGAELWVTDGTEEGTYMVKEINTFGTQSGFTTSYNSNFVALGDHFYFPANSHDYGYELWKSDGTEEGTVMVKDIFTGNFDGMSFSATLFLFNDELFFWAEDAEYGKEFWKSDGTAEGTQLLVDFTEGPADTWATQFNFKVTDTHFIMTGYSDETGREPWISDGTPEGTHLLKNIMSFGDGLVLSYDMINYEGETYFKADSPSKGEELWKTDGTEDGTVLVKDVYDGPESGKPTGFFIFNDRLFFKAISEDDGAYDLWSTDGTAENTVRLKDMSTEEFVGVGFVQPANDVVFFESNTTEYGREMWMTDGTEAGTELLLDATPGEEDSYFGHYDTKCGYLYYVCSADGKGAELWAIETGLVLDNPTMETAEDLMTIYPNPSNGDFTIDFPNYAKHISIEVYNTAGTLVHQENATNTNQIGLSLDITDGIYILKVNRDGEVAHKKIIKGA